MAEAEALWAVREKPYLESESIPGEWITGLSEGEGSQCNQLANKYPGGVLERQCHISNSSLIHVAASWMAVASITVIIIRRSPCSQAHAWPPSPLTMETLLTVCHASTGVVDDREWLVSPELIYLHDHEMPPLWWKLFVTPWTVAYQAPPSMGFSRQEYWSGLPFPSPDESFTLSINIQYKGLPTLRPLQYTHPLDSTLDLPLPTIHSYYF